MVAPAAEPSQLSMPVLEWILTLLSIGLCIAMPRLGSRTFARTEKLFAQLARRRSLSVLVVGLTAMFLRLAILPLCPIPAPFVPDDFSFLLAADTFAHGRLSNPTPAMWTHFESLHITMVPTYMSMYFPAQGLILAAGKVFLGHPWFALLIVDALMCAAICWMLQAWLPPRWALLGGLVAILRIGLFSYWINTYTGAGCVSALGGALVLGAFPRVRKSIRLRDCALLAIGIILLLYSRPYEGFLVCLPVTIGLAHWIFFSKERPPLGMLIRPSALPLALVAAAIVWLGYYDQQNFGSPLTLPYTINRATYAVAPYWIWEKPRPIPTYRNQEIHDFYVKGEFKSTSYYHTLSGFLLINIFKPVAALKFLGGITLLPALLMSRRLFLDRRIRFFTVGLLIWLPGMFIVVFLLPHYLAPFTAIFYVFEMQALRHLWLWKPGKLPVGRAMVRLIVLSCIALAGLRAWAEPLRLGIETWPGAKWVSDWYGPGFYGATRLRVEQELDKVPGQKLVLVRYADNHEAIDEWVYNEADIDHSKVIWAHDMDAANNEELIHYYKDRSLWLVEPDANPVKVTPYSGLGSTSHAREPKNIAR